MLKLLELVADWAARFSRLLVLGDFNVHVDRASSSQGSDLVTSMATLGLTQFVAGPTHQAGHTLDLIFGMGIQAGSVQNILVPWSDHVALKVRIRVPPPTLYRRRADFCSPKETYGSNWFPECSERSDAPGDSVDDLTEDWYNRLSEAIDRIAP